jgi:iron complex outermembrane receptor protein
VERDTFDVDWRHFFTLGEAHEIMWGLGARIIGDRTEDGYNLIFHPRDRTLTTYSAFVQDTITLAPGRLFAMIGSKFENNTYTDYEIQPSARLWWTPDERNTVWASVSRAVRVPSRSERDGMIVFGYIDSGLLAGGPLSGDIIPLGVAGNPDLNAEELVAYEAGWRGLLADDFSLSLALFYNDYDDLIYVPSVIEPFNNDGTGETYGGEVSAAWQVADNWKLQGSYSYVNVLIHGPVLAVDEGNTPRNLVKLQSQLDITDDLEFNAGLYYVDSVPSQNVDSYIRLDIGLTWRPTANFELAVWGQNLLDPQHPEFSASEAPRSFYIMGTIRF